mgnify:CR=1 FL=1
MHKYIHEYDNEWGYFVKLDDINACDKDKDEYADEYKYKYEYNEEKYKDEYADDYKYKYEYKKEKEVQHNKYETINKSLVAYFVVTILIYICYIIKIAVNN